jgi:hypothetical protein
MPIHNVVQVMYYQLFMAVLAEGGISNVNQL